MNTIIQQVAEKIMKRSTKNLENALKNQQDISEYIANTEQMLHEAGTELVKYLLDVCEESIRESPKRKRGWYVEKREQQKTISTIFGNVEYTRTYYKNKMTGEYSYLSDDFLGIRPHERMDKSLQSRLVEKAMDVSYEKSGKTTVKTDEFTKQTVMNHIRKIGVIDNSAAETVEEKREVPILYIEADEDHVAMQDGSNKQPRLIYVHEGKEKVGKRRNQLINVRYFTGLYKNSEQLWLEVADYIEKAYDNDKLEKVYLSGDGATWIKEGLGWIVKSEFVLDRFHLSKYVRKATAHVPHTTSVLWDYIENGRKQFAKDLLSEILKMTQAESKRESVKEARRYIMNHWDGIMRQYEGDYIGCSAEGHISHILSARLSSRPLGWCETGADQMARLRVLRENGGKVYEIIKQRDLEREKEKRIGKLDERIVNKRLRKINETLDNIPILSIGKKTWACEMLKTFRGA